MLFISLDIELNCTVLPHLSLRIFKKSVRSLARRFFTMIPKYFTFFRRMLGAVQSAIFISSRRFTWTDCIFYLEISSVYLLGVGRRGGSSSLTFPDLTRMVGIFPVGVFRRFSSFVYMFRYFNFIEHLIDLSVGYHLKIPALQIQLILPSIVHGLYQDITDLLFFHLILVVRIKEEGYVVIYIVYSIC